MTPRLEVIVHDTHVQLLARHRLVAEVGWRPDGQVHLRVPRDIDGIVPCTEPALDLEPLEVEVVTTERPPEGSVALPRRIRRPATAETIRPARARRRRTTVLSKTDQISPEVAGVLRLAILDEAIDQPDLSAAQRAANTRALAERHGVGVMAVAGVRANFARGSYGNPASLVATRRAQRARHRDAAS